MNYKIILIIISVIIFTLISINECARILAVFPTASISHQLPFRPLTQELAKRGHKVVVVTPNPAFEKGKAPDNLKEIDVHNISYSALNRRLANEVTGDRDQLYVQMKAVLEMAIDNMEGLLQNDDIKQILTEKFDLLFLEHWFRPILSLTHVFDAPVISISSFGEFIGSCQFLGADNNPLIYPHAISQKSINLTLLEKISELSLQYSIKKMYYELEVIETEILRKYFGQDMLPLNELCKKVDMLFLNVHHMWDSNRPVPPNVIYIGGIHITEDKDLPQDLKHYLEMSVHGVIYLSFGTNVIPSLLPEDKISQIIKVLSRLPYDVLWKWDKDELPGISSNIKISKWFPQKELLRHPSLKLFITQGGLQSTDEAIMAGVPLLGFPMLCDQWHNTEKYVKNKIGLQLDFSKLTEETFENAVLALIKDERYRQNIASLRRLMTDQPQSALERAVWWTEHLLRHGGARHLRASAADLHWTEYYEIRFISTVVILFLGAVILLLFILYMICSSNIFRLRSTVKPKFQ